MPVETGLQVTGQGGGYISSAPKVASVANGGVPASVFKTTASDPARAKVEQAQQAVAALDQANRNWQGLRKSMAALRLQRLVNIIKVLALYGGDGKAVARQAADLAGELRATVKEFAAAGGDPSTVPGATSDPTVGLAGGSGTTEADSTLSAALTSITSSLTNTSSSLPAPASSGFVFQASSLLSQLRTVVASSHRAKSPMAKTLAQQQFDAVAGSAAGAIEQAKNSVNILT